ncbi:hypothetical protein KW849_05285 [Pseudomonas sp. PDM26]|nr:hypothetical protein [Pseudomonas sp. PDM26]
MVLAYDSLPTDVKQEIDSLIATGSGSGCGSTNPPLFNDVERISRRCHRDRGSDGDRARSHDDHSHGNNLDHRPLFGRSHVDDHDRDIDRTFLRHPSAGRSLPTRRRWKWPRSRVLRDSYERPKRRKYGMVTTMTIQ